VTTFAPERETTVGLAVERHLQAVDEHGLHKIGPGPGENLRRLLVADAAPCTQDVADEEFGRITLATEDDAALRPVRVRLLALRGARDDHHVEPRFREFERRRAAGDAAAEDQDVAVDRVAQSIFGPTASMRSTERSARTRMSSGTSISQRM
jgi:hypothetical protein